MLTGSRYKDMQKPSPTMRALPCALAISGLDPSGGAGLLADLRAFQAASVWGCGAVAVSTVQSTAGLRSSHPVATSHILAQVRELWSTQNIQSIKIGALGSTENVRGIARWLATLPARVPIVIDPVLRASRGRRGARLLEDGALPAIRKMIERGAIVTPNVSEAEILLGTNITTHDDVERAARAFVLRGARAAVVKGGHLPPSRSSTVVDVLAVGNLVLHLPSPRAKVAPHGTGCMLASLIAGRLAAMNRDDDKTLIAAIRWAKGRLQRSLVRPISIGAGQWVMS